MTEQSLVAEALSQVWFQFFLVAIFGFLTGLEFREYILLRSKERPEVPSISLGTTRTFTFVAVLGFVLYLLDPGFHLYLAGMLGLMIFFALFYHQKLQSGQPCLLQPLISLVVYTYGPVILLQPPWFLVLLFVAIVFIFSGHYKATSLQQLSAAIIIAAGSNNLLKAVYAVTLGGLKNSGRIAFYLLILGLGTIGYGLSMSLDIL